MGGSLRTPRWHHGSPHDDESTNGEGEKVAATRGLEVYEQVMDRATIALAALDVEGCFTFVNRRTCEIAGYTRDELIGRHYWLLLSPEEVPAVTRQFARVIERGSSILQMETHLIRKDGGRRILNVDLGPLLEHETVLGAICSADDVTTRHRVEQHLLAMQSVALHTRDAVLIADAAPVEPLQARIVFINPAFTRLTGYTETDALRQTLALLFAETADAEVLSALTDARRQHEAVRLEIQLRREDGTWRWVDTVFVPVTNPSQQLTHWIAIQRDIADQKAHEEEVRAVTSYERVITAPRSVVERWVGYVIKVCDATSIDTAGDFKTLEAWARQVAVSYSTLCETCRLLGIRPLDGRDFARVLNALRAAIVHRCAPEVLLNVSNRRVLRTLSIKAGINLEIRVTNISLHEFLANQRFIPKGSEALRLIRVFTSDWSRKTRAKMGNDPV